MDKVWVFMGPRAAFPSGVFSRKDLAEEWIRTHGLSGTLTAYPIDIGLYEWAANKGHFRLLGEDHRNAEFIQQFSSSHQEHYHYGNGDAGC